jgi:hypothetical protein
VSEHEDLKRSVWICSQGVIYPGGYATEDDIPGHRDCGLILFVERVGRFDETN